MTFTFMDNLMKLTSKFVNGTDLGQLISSNVYQIITGFGLPGTDLYMLQPYYQKGLLASPNCFL